MKRYFRIEFTLQVTTGASVKRGSILFMVGNQFSS
ncbi:unnamed protein product [Chondrus crispus]|uniref:Uncharacterized protein n=1 Tax=Chondrus crispus TaxID=2769 RepID=R7QS12_CHOCR|nr:unnamed protein product [Chondrus crispus]CDF40306.1 unnamed protein product [Chondrus crispus]|eukprot:XP_005710600.1 unnamed protein product [Chondrus crispus]